MKRFLFLVFVLFTFTTFADNKSAISQTAKDSVKVIDTAKSVDTASVIIPIQQIAENVPASWWDELLVNIFGENLDWVGYVSCFFFAFIGLFFRWYWRAKSGAKKNPISPGKLNWEYWWKDNILPKLTGILATILVIFLGLRFSMELIGTIPSMFMALTIGLCFDWIADKIKNIKPPVSK